MVRDSGLHLTFDCISATSIFKILESLSEMLSYSLRLLGQARWLQLNMLLI